MSVNEKFSHKEKLYVWQCHLKPHPSASNCQHLNDVNLLSVFLGENPESPISANEQILSLLEIILWRGQYFFVIVYN